MKSYKAVLFLASPLIFIICIFVLFIIFGSTSSSEGPTVLISTTPKLQKSKLITPKLVNEPYKGDLQYTVLTSEDKVITKDVSGKSLNEFQLNLICDNGEKAFDFEILEYEQKVTFYTVCSEGIRLMENNELIRLIEYSEIGINEKLNYKEYYFTVKFSEDLEYMFYSIKTDDSERTENAYRSGLLNLGTNKVVLISPDRTDFTREGLGIVGYFSNNKIIIFYQKSPSGALAEGLYEYNIEKQSYESFHNYGISPSDVIQGRNILGNKLVFHNAYKPYSDELYKDKAYLVEIDFGEYVNEQEYELPTRFYFHSVADFANGLQQVSDDGKISILKTSSPEWEGNYETITKSAYVDSKIVVSSEGKILKEYFVDPRKIFRYSHVDNEKIVFAELKLEYRASEDGVGVYSEYVYDSLHLLDMKKDEVNKVTDLGKDTISLLGVKF
jgi:hypothetical protein